MYEILWKDGSARISMYTIYEKVLDARDNLLVSVVTLNVKLPDDVQHHSKIYKFPFPYLEQKENFS